MAAKKAPAKKQAATRAAAKKQAATKQAAARKAAAKKTPTKKTPATKQAAKQTPARKSAAKTSAAKPAKRSAATSAPASSKQAANNKTTSKKTASNKTADNKTTSKKATTTKSAATEERSPAVQELPKPRFNKDGFGYTKDFDLSFVKQMYDLLQEERVMLTGQAKRLEDEAHQLVEEAEMGDVQFDDEGGEGDTMVVERERDLALSAQAREAVLEIDAAIDRIMTGTYGYSTVSGRPIPRERLEAIPWSAELVEEKVGGIGRR